MDRLQDRFDAPCRRADLRPDCASRPARHTRPERRKESGAVTPQERYDHMSREIEMDGRVLVEAIERLSTRTCLSSWPAEARDALGAALLSDVPNGFEAGKAARLAGHLFAGPVPHGLFPGCPRALAARRSTQGGPGRPDPRGRGPLPARRAPSNRHPRRPLRRGLTGSTALRARGPCVDRQRPSRKDAEAIRWHDDVAARRSGACCPRAPDRRPHFSDGARRARRKRNADQIRLRVDAKTDMP